MWKLIPGRGLKILFLLTLLITSTSHAADETAEKPELIGTVLDGNKQPVAGATVMIWTAGVKTGYSTYCPSCYADCGKRATTEADGRFSIPRLSPDLYFRLLIVGESFAPTFVNRVDPAKGEVTAELAPKTRPSNTAQIVQGRVLDSLGHPISGALVEAQGVSFVDGRGSWGSIDGLDPLAVTNDEGKFEITYTKPAESFSLTVKSRGMAFKKFERLKTGDKIHDLKLNSGATIRGRLVHKGQPISGAEIGLVSQSRSMTEFYPEERIGTKRDGTFEFVNVPTRVSWYVYPKMESVVQYGASDSLTCVTNKENETIDVGKIELRPGHRLKGQVLLNDHQPIPPGMRIFLSLDRAWDSQTTLLPPDGTFEFVNLPTSDCYINPAVKGYVVSKDNPNHGHGLEGKIDRDIDDFVILLQPGAPDFSTPAGQKRGKPLQSARRP